MTRLLVVAALLAACSKGDSGPPCDKVVDHMMDLTKQMMPGHDPESLGNRKQMIEQCKSRKYSAATRRCLVDAKSFNDLATCQTRDQKTSTPTPPAPPEQPAPTPQAPAPAPPAGSGSSS